MKAAILFIVFIIIAFLVLSAFSTGPSEPLISGIVNPVKKITGKTSHDRRVIFNEYSDILKYSPETGQNLAFVSQKIKDKANVWIHDKIKDLPTNTATAIATEEGVIGSSEAAIGIEEIAALGVVL